MINLFSSNYLSRMPIEKAMRDFATGFTKEQKILDIGCGNKPYASYFSCKYLGLDPYPGTKADIVRDAWDSGLADNSLDAVILNQSLEHIPETIQTITEIERILKPGGLVLVTVPQTMRNHGTPILAKNAPYKNFNPQQVPYWNHDYWRFTKFGLIHLFKNFEILLITPNQSYISTLIQLWNYLIASFNLGIIVSPLYFINNILAILIDTISSIVSSKNLRYKALIHEGLTIDHTLIARKKSL